ncbi:drug resistance transporter, EmrB/QacA subfamily [Sphingomonas sp. YR710]|nr:drug resistance transporter, EmrB/QacA subfamily [Sphingomonas sp. YR710]
MIAATVVGCAAFMQAFDTSAVSIALPKMAASFGVPVLSLNIVVTAYLIGATAILPLCGWAADRFGARAMFLLAVATFGLSAFACGLATSLPVLLAARVLEGCAGALLLPVGRIIVLRSIDKSEFVRAMSMLTLPVMLGPVIGPPIGGLIVTIASWRWLFFANVPIAVIGLLLVWRFVGEIRSDEKHPIDLVGAILIITALAGLTFGIAAATRADLPPWLIGGVIVAGAVCSLLYIVHARRRPNPILDLGSLDVLTSRVSSVGGMFVRMLTSSVPYLLAMLFQVGFGMSAVETGGLIFAGAIGSLLSRGVINPVLTLFGFRRFLILNTVLIALLVAACALLTRGTPHVVILALLFAQGLLRSLQLMGLNAVGYADLPQREFAAASTIASVSQQLSQSLGIAASVIVVQLLQRMIGVATLDATVIAPAFVAIAALSMTSLHWMRQVPADAGAAMIKPRRTRPLR